MRFTRPGACAASVGFSPKATVYAALAGGFEGGRAGEGEHVKAWVVCFSPKASLYAVFYAVLCWLLCWLEGKGSRVTLR